MTTSGTVLDLIGISAVSAPPVHKELAAMLEKQQDCLTARGQAGAKLVRPPSNQTLSIIHCKEIPRLPEKQQDASAPGPGGSEALRQAPGAKRI